jgi:hypothetical protein
MEADSISSIRAVLVIFKKSIVISSYAFMELNQPLWDRVHN